MQGHTGGPRAWTPGVRNSAAANAGGSSSRRKFDINSADTLTPIARRAFYRVRAIWKAGPVSTVPGGKRPGGRRRARENGRRGQSGSRGELLYVLVLAAWASDSSECAGMTGYAD